jgi:hypothetical protein
MENRKVLLLALFSMVLVFSQIRPASVGGASAIVRLSDDLHIAHSTVDGSGLASTMALNTPEGDVMPMVTTRGPRARGRAQV